MGRPNTPEQALAFFATLSPSTIRLGLDRVQAALDRLGRPDHKFRSLQVAGTNGKGSTCAFAAQILKEAGHRVGLYTSPHLVRVNERIQIDGVPISDEVFGRRILEVLDRCPEALEDPSALTYFEVGTLVALWHFAQEGVEFAVLETGLGGRLDATTAARVQVTAITSVSFDHMQYLGNTLREIATEKAGILRPGVPLVVSRQHPDALGAIESKAAELNVPVLREGEQFAVVPSRTRGRVRYDRGQSRADGLELGLAGAHQLSNAGVAITALTLMPGTKVSDESMRRGLADTRWPGRFEILRRDPTVVVDGAHNVGGVEVLLHALKGEFPGRKLHLVFGVLADKDHAAIRALLFPRASAIHLCPVASPRTLPPEASLEDAKKATSEVFLHHSVAAAVDVAVAQAPPDAVVVCAGSLFLVGAVRAHFGK